MVAAPVLVGMTEIRITTGAGELTCLGLGSCIALCGYDSTAKVGGMVHIVLPHTLPEKEAKLGRFADTAVPELLHQLEKAGADRKMLRFAMVGGAKVINFGDGNAMGLDIGTRNVNAVKHQIQNQELDLVGIDVGGSLARTILMNTETGDVTVRTVTRGEKPLCSLRGNP